MMKIAIVGTFSSGKTTLISDIQGHPALWDYLIDTGREREIAHKMNVQFGQMSKERMREFQLALTHYELYYLLANRNFITDCPAFLAQVYCDIAGVSDKLMCELVQRAVSAYDLIFFIPLCETLPIGADGVRMMDNDVRVRVDARLGEILQDFKGITHTVPADVRERAAFTLDIIRYKQVKGQ